MLQSADVWLLERLVPWHAPALDVGLAWISAAGTAGGLWAAFGVFGLAEPRWRAGAWRLLLTVALTLLVNNVMLKPVVARARPAPLQSALARELPMAPPTYSFPSGHTASSVGPAIAMTRMWPGGRVVWWALAALTAYSRIYLGHHYPLDVVGGAIVGALVALWVLGGRNRATDARTLPSPLPAGTVVRP
jgi:undecaprenyl-diphosphatase